MNCWRWYPKAYEPRMSFKCRTTDMSRKRLAVATTRAEERRNFPGAEARSCSRLAKTKPRNFNKRSKITFAISRTGTNKQSSVTMQGPRPKPSRTSFTLTKGITHLLQSALRTTTDIHGYPSSSSPRASRSRPTKSGRNGEPIPANCAEHTGAPIARLRVAVRQAC